MPFRKKGTTIWLARYLKSILSITLIKYKGIRLSVSFVGDFRKVEFGQLQSLERLSVKEQS